MTDWSKKFNELSYKTASYIEAVQPGLDKLAEYDNQKAAFVKRATAAVRTLAKNGLVDKNAKGELVDKIAESPEKVFDIIEKLASALASNESLGDVSEKVAADATSVDPFEREFFGRSAVNSGAID